MQLNKKLFIPLLVYSAFIFAIGYTVTTTYEPVTNLFTGMFLDSLDTLDNPPADFTYNKDVSQMFNERGFYKSSSANFDENEIINDFNGSLMYEIPLYNFKQAGEMRFDVKLVYNGSVGHKMFVCDSTKYSNLNQVYSYNMNAPEWILSLNGIAVQVFNFETNFFTNTISNNEIKNYDVNMLIPGYHFDDDMRNLPSGGRDRINILMGDGSTITLVNLSASNSYEGDYYSEGKESYYKAKVYFVETSGDGSYRNRVVELSMGDGMLYIFHEHKREFNDLKFGTGLTYMRPQMLLLEAIKDKLGNKINLGYEFYRAPSTFSGILFGRPLFVGATSNSAGNFNVLYSGSTIKLAHSSSVNGNYFFSIDPPAYYTNTNNSGTANNIASFTKIRNPLFQESHFQYYETPNYKRTLVDIPNPYPNSNTLDIVFTNLRRIKNYTNFLGGYREYSYYGDNEISLTYNADTYNKTAGYVGYGREPFYTNMLSRKKDKDEKGNWKSQTDFSYYYEDKGGSFSQFPVDAADSLSTSIETVSLDNINDNNSVTSLKSIKYYTTYPVKYPLANPFPPETNVFEFNGSTKLIQDETIEVNSGSAYQRNIYTYETGTQPGGMFIGSMLMNTRKNIMNGKERNWTFAYGYDGTSNEFDRPIISKTETDPLGNKTESSYLNLDTAFYFNIFTAGYDGEKDTLEQTYYKIGLPYQVIRKDASNNIIAKNTSGYLRTLNDNRGYYGQLVTEKTFRAPDFNAGIETNYEYYKLDTIGQAFYTGGTIPYKEGNLKVVKSPGNQETAYFYHPISLFEDETYNPAITVPIRPEITYRKKYKNGTVVIEKSFITDNRLPIRIDSYKRTGTNTADTLKKVYFEYNEAGYPTKIINDNRYLTELLYQATHRISSITLPGDFSTGQNDTTFLVDTNYFYDSVNVSSPGWGVNNELSNNYLTFVNAPQILRSCQNFYMKYKLVSESYTHKGGMFIKFDVIPNFSEVISANLKFAIKGFTRTKGGVQMQDNEFFIALKPITTLGNVVNIFGCPGNLSIFATSGINISSLSQNISINTSGTAIYKHQSIDVTSLLNTLLGTQSQPLAGIYVTGGLAGNPPDPLPDYELLLDGNIHQTTAPQDWKNWADSCIPYLSIYGIVDASDTLKIVNVDGGTYVYTYDDINNTITTHSRLTHSPNVMKRIKYYVDGFGNIRQKNNIVNNFENNIDSNRFFYNYNYLLKLASDIDPTNDTTWHSYDLLGRDSITEHQDYSISSNGNLYQSSLQTAFYNISSGFVEKQTFKDESNKYFNKYFDAVGNLLREEKFVAGDGSGKIEESDTPFDPDTTYTGQSVPSQMIALVTDYEYDNLYRLTRVKTPGGKFIQYWYDGYSRQIQRLTADAGLTKYSYDDNGNLILSQDANQRALDYRLFTKRTYDGVNRVLTIGDFKPNNFTPPEESGPFGGDTTVPYEFDYVSGNPDSIYIINVYDTIPSAVYDIFNSNKPSDYGSVNYTKGQLVATAYRTKLGESWNYKFYRYDERGNIIKFWHYISGLGWKALNYSYNSQNKVTGFGYQAGQSDGKVFSIGYDNAARLSHTSLYIGTTPIDPEEESDAPSVYLTMAKYWYNADQQIDTLYLNVNSKKLKHRYNKRNWLEYLYTANFNPEFSENVTYNPNGNIRKMDLGSSYSTNFSTQGALRYTFIYDNSNRLLKAELDSGQSINTFDIINNYDSDGNFKSMKRYGSSNNLADNFTYQYFSGTNRVQKLAVQIHDDYAYDNNGNITYDNINKNSSIKYDWRNLMIENLNTLSQFTYRTFYRYDEAGNRISKKQYLYVNGSPPGGVETGIEGTDSLFIDEGDGNGYWALTVNNYYVRDFSGNEIAIYQGSNIEQWNIYALDIVGKIDANSKRYFYIKDHLGSIRIVMDTTNSIVFANDYDIWGYPLENRFYERESQRYKFTGKERDNELQSSYDYFGARYYDSRIGRWGQVDPLFEKYASFSTYTYGLNNPNIFLDPNGKWTARYDETNKVIYVTAEENDNLENLYKQMGLSKNEFYEKYGINDDFLLEAGAEFDITEFLLGNAKLSDDATNMNCYSSCLTITGLLSEEVAVMGGFKFSSSIKEDFGYKETKEVKTGTLKTFEDNEGVTHHAAVFVIRSQKGVEYYFGRPGPGTDLNIQTSDRLNQLYPDFKTYSFINPNK